MKTYYVIEFRSNNVIHHPTLLLQTTLKDKADSFYENLQGCTGPHFVKLIEFDNINNNSSIFEFGKYKGKKITNIPDTYLCWLFFKTDKKNDNSVICEIIRRAIINKKNMDEHNRSVAWYHNREEQKLQDEKEKYAKIRFELM